jgi:hypothetical protein
MTCLGITGAMRTTPAVAIEVLLGLPQLHLQVEAEAILRCSDRWKSKSEGFEHVNMTQDMKKDPSYRWGLIK